MLRAVLVSAAGLILSSILAALGTLFVLRHTDFGRLMTGNSVGITNRWQVFMSGGWVLFFCVAFPTVAVVSIFVGLLTKILTNCGSNSSVANFSGLFRIPPTRCLGKPAAPVHWDNPGGAFATRG